MTEQELAAISARHAAASPGPWKVDDDEGCVVGTGPDGGAVIKPQHWVSDGDLAFIAASWSDIAALLAEVRRLRAELHRVDGLPDGLEKWRCYGCDFVTSSRHDVIQHERRMHPERWP